MRDRVTQITLRVPAAAIERLAAFCAEHGVSKRGLFEAAAAVALEDEERLLTTGWMAKVYTFAKEIEGTLRTTKPRHQLVVSMRPELATRFKDACKRYGISQNAALAMVIMVPWPVDGDPVFGQYQKEALVRVVRLARHLDHERRKGKGAGP